MGKQVGFYAVGADHDELLQRIEGLALVALPAAISGDQAPEPVPPHAFRLSDRIWRFFYLVPRDLDRSNVEYTPMRIPPTHRLVAERSPAIELRPSTVDGSGVERGRIHFGLSRGTPGYEVVERQYNSLARWIRRWPRTDQAPYYVGPETATRARAGELRLLNGQAEFHVVDSKK